MPSSAAPARPGLRPPERCPLDASCPGPARQSPGGRAAARKPPDSGRRALTRASSRATPAPPLPPALAAGQLAARVLEERVREEMKWLLPPVVPGSAPAPGPGPGDLDPRRRRELFRVFTMVEPGGRGLPRARRARRARESWGRPARRPGSRGQWRRAGRRAHTDAAERRRGQATVGQRRGSRREEEVTRGGSNAPGRRPRPSAGFALLSGSRAEPPFLPLSLPFSLLSSVRQGSSAAGPTGPLPAVAAAGRCEASQPFPWRLLPPLPPPFQ